MLANVCFVRVQNNIFPSISFQYVLCIHFTEPASQQCAVLTCYKLDTYPSLEGRHCVVVEVQNSHLVVLLSQNEEGLLTITRSVTKRHKLDKQCDSFDTVL